MSYDTNLISHIRKVNECLQSHNASAELDPENLNLRIRCQGRYIELQPQFVFPKDGSIAFSPKLLGLAREFCGWRPYFNRVWPLAVDKLEFKEFCASKKLLTPRRWMNPAEVDANVILKKARSSFAHGISGPFTPALLRSSQMALEAGDFFEEFISGSIAKVWYWNDTPVCLDMRSMPTVVGDGKRALRELIANACLPYIPINWQVQEMIARFQGVSLESVIETGKAVMIDFRYLSAFHSASIYIENKNVLSQQVNAKILKELQSVGEVFAGSIPEELRQNTIYSIDAIIDSSERIWFLEMNCNPIVHPDLYASMFESLFGQGAVNRAYH